MQCFELLDLSLHVFLALLYKPHVACVILLMQTPRKSEFVGELIDPERNAS